MTWTEASGLQSGCSAPSNANYDRDLLFSALGRRGLISVLGVSGNEALDFL